MSLETWQAELVGALTTDADSAFASSPGFRLTRRVQREWRAFRIRSSLPLTCRLLGTRCADALDRYLDAVLEPSSFFLREAEQFAAHCRFEERAKTTSPPWRASSWPCCAGSKPAPGTRQSSPRVTPRVSSGSSRTGPPT